jgi:hypothetical protein
MLTSAAALRTSHRKTRFQNWSLAQARGDYRCGRACFRDHVGEFVLAPCRDDELGPLLAGSDGKCPPDACGSTDDDDAFPGQRTLSYVDPFLATALDRHHEAWKPAGSMPASFCSGGLRARWGHSAQPP